MWFDDCRTQSTVNPNGVEIVFTVSRRDRYQQLSLPFPYYFILFLSAWSEARNRFVLFSFRCCCRRRRLTGLRTCADPRACWSHTVCLARSYSMQTVSDTHAMQSDDDRAKRERCGYALRVPEERVMEEIGRENDDETITAWMTLQSFLSASECIRNSFVFWNNNKFPINSEQLFCEWVFPDSRRNISPDRFAMKLTTSRRAIIANYTRYVALLYTYLLKYWRIRGPVLYSSTVTG